MLAIQIFVFTEDFSIVTSGLSSPSRIAATFLILALTAAIVDVISFCQTKILLGILRSVKRLEEAVLLFFAELLVTVNIFTLVFATGLAYSLFVLSGDELNREFVGSIDFETSARPDSYADQSAYPEDAYEIFTDAAWRAQVSIEGVVQDKTTNVSGSTNVFSNKAISGADIRKALSAIRSQAGQLQNIKEASGTAYHDTDFGKIDFQYNTRGDLHIVTYSFLHNIWHWYSSAYGATDSVQDNFR